MKKSEVVTRYERGVYRPAHNVKVYGCNLAPHLAAVGEDVGVADDPRWNAEYLEKEAEKPHYFEWACEDGWERLQEYALEIWGGRAKVYSDGRCGGWAVVEGLPDVADWDAVAVGKWARFCKYADEVVADIPYQMTWSIAVNGLRPIIENEERTEAEKRGRALAGDMLAALNPWG